MTWKDITCYSRGETDRTPRAWEARAGHLRLAVFRHKFMSDMWCTTCLPFFDTRGLPVEDVEEAKAMTVEAVKILLKDALSELESA